MNNYTRRYPMQFKYWLSRKKLKRSQNHLVRLFSVLIYTDLGFNLYKKTISYVFELKQICYFLRIASTMDLPGVDFVISTRNSLSVEKWWQVSSPELFPHSSCDPVHARSGEFCELVLRSTEPKILYFTRDTKSHAWA